MSTIHSTFKKKDLLTVIRNNKLNINIDFSRDRIAKEISKYIDEYNLQFLYKENTRKSLSIRDKEHIIKLCRKIKTFCKSGLDINKGLYNNLDELITDTIFISSYGEISTVRKVVKIVEGNINIKFPIVIPDYIKEEIQERKKYKIDQVPCLQIKRGSFYIDLA
tara:strand:- start:45 stop:536 length:492 start_codon:yes stop_codon:yes gene_type:complete